MDFDAAYDYAAEIADARDHGYDDRDIPSAAELAEDAAYNAQGRSDIPVDVSDFAPVTAPCPHGRLVCEEDGCDVPF